MRDTLLFIGQSNPTRAGKFADPFARTIENLVNMPNRGSPRELDEPRLRVWPIANFETYLIFYKPLLA